MKSTTIAYDRPTMVMTSVDIDPELLADVKAEYGVKTNREAIHRALLDASKKRRMLRAIDTMATIEVDLHPKSYDEMLAEQQAATSAGES